MDLQPLPSAGRNSLIPFFRPQSVAVVGASRDPASIGNRLLQAILRGGYQGIVFPVNPRYSSVDGLRCFPSLRQLPEPAELAVVAVPRESVLGVVDDCVAAGTRAVIVISSGFAEADDEGRELERRLVEKVRAHGIRLIGPNCLGLLTTDPEVGLNASFVAVSPPAGRVAMSSESGAIGLALLVAASRMGLGISSCVSVGNRADVSSNDLLEYWEEDDATELILLYLESFGNPRRFARIARRVCRRKPVVAVKAGRTSAGRRAAGSHTAALAASDVAVDALFAQTGVIRADTLAEMFDLAAALSSQPLPAGRRVGVVTNAGGPGILCADACEAAGLILPTLSPGLQKQLRAFLPASASVGNPVDLISSATPEHFRRAVAMVGGSREVDALVVISVAARIGASRQTLEAVNRARASLSDMPLLACVMAEQEEAAAKACCPAEIPWYSYPEEPARVLGKMAAYAQWRRQPPGRLPTFDDINLTSAREICQQALRRRGPGWLAAEDVYSLLRQVGLPLVPGKVARSPDEAAQAARSLGFPVAVKLASRTIIHKTDVAGVRLGMANEAAVRRAYEDIEASLAETRQLEAMEGVLVQPMVSGTELLVGLTQDPLFGPILAFGLGGVFVEVLGDVCCRVLPLTDRDAAEMIAGIRASRLLDGYRGHPPADRAAIEAILLRLSVLAEGVPEVQEMDLNPVFALPPGQGCLIADARVRVAEAGSPPAFLHGQAGKT